MNPSTMPLTIDPTAPAFALSGALPGLGHGVMLASVVCAIALCWLLRSPGTRAKLTPRRPSRVLPLPRASASRGKALPPRAIPQLLVVVIVLAGAGLSCACDGVAVSVPAAEHAKAPGLVWTRVVSGPSALPEACRQQRAESFPQIVQHPLEPQRLSVVYFQDGNLSAVGAASTDGGHSWWRAPISDASACAGGPDRRDRLFNPLIAASADGWVYFGASHGRVSAHASVDAAGAWNRGVEPGTLPPEDSAENLNLLADPQQPGRVQALWTQFDYPAPEPFPLFTSSALRTSTSSDHGRTFGPDRQAARAPLGSLIINGRLARASDGAMLACYDSVPALMLINSFTLRRTAFSVFCTRSNDGEQWTTPVPAGPSVFLPLPDPEGVETAGAESGGIAFSAKFDLATGPDGMAALVHADLQDGVGQLKLALSGDGGRSWGPPAVVIERDAPLFMPAVAIDAQGGIGLFWYDWTRDRAGDEPLSTDAWFAWSADLGASWTVRHLAGPFDLRAAYDATLGYDGGALGAYQDLVAMSEGFGAVFTVGPPLATDGGTDVLFARLQAE